MAMRSSYGLAVPLRQTDLRLLAHLDVLLDLQNVSLAAEKMGLSQPAMSRVLARLRDQMQDALLVRSGSQMVLTPRAEELREPLRRWLAEAEILLQPKLFDPATVERSFRVATTDYGILSVIRPALHRMSKEASRCRLDIEMLSVNSLQKMAEGRLDLVVTGYTPDQTGILSRKLFRESRLAVCRRGHPVLDGELTQDRFFDWPHIATGVGEGFMDPLPIEAPEMKRRQLIFTGPSFSALPMLLDDSDALAVLPSRAAHYYAERHDLETFKAPVEFGVFDYYVAWHERSHADAGTQWLIESLAAQFIEG